LRRQAGASDVDLDAQEGFAVLTVATPNRLDLPALIENVKGAGYTTTTLHLVTDARVVTGFCPDCKREDATCLEIAETGQRIGIQGIAAIDSSTQRIKGSITGWSSDDPKIELLPF
jgi:hypothetical protein